MGKLLKALKRGVAAVKADLGPTKYNAEGDARMVGVTEEQLLSVIADKLTRLERQARSTRLTLYVWVAITMYLSWSRFNFRDVLLSNELSQTSAAFETVGDGRIGIYFFDKDHKVRAELGLSPDGSPKLLLTDKNGSVLYKAP